MWRGDGTVWSWGANNWGQLGDGTFTPRAVPVRVSGLTNVTAIAAGLNHSLAVRADGTVWAWGNNAAGNLGDGTLTVRNAPVQVVGLTGADTVAAGSGFSLAVKQDRTVWGWGANISGQLGDGSTTGRLTPVRVVGLGPVRTIAAGMSHVLAIRDDLSVWGWGGNDSGQLGDNTRQSRSIPVQALNLADAVDVTAGRESSAALLANGTVKTWGTNAVGQLGSDAQVEDQLLPRPIPSFGFGWRFGTGPLALHVMAVRTVPAPPFFTLAVDPTGVGVSAGDSVSVAVTTVPVNNSTQTVTLTATGLPPGVTASFRPSSVVAGGSAKLTLTSHELVPAGVSTVTVTGATPPLTTDPVRVSVPLELKIGPAKDPGCAGTNRSHVDVPDAGPAVLSPINLAGCQWPDLTTTSVEVHIGHPRRGDLVIDLVAPDGTEYRLKNASPADIGRDIHQTFPLTVGGRIDPTMPSQWRLKVQDVRAGFAGTLSAWTIFL